MILTYESFTARMYRDFYNTVEMPKNLCTYFWKLVLMYFLIVPFLISKTVVFLSPKKLYDNSKYARLGVYKTIDDMWYTSKILFLLYSASSVIYFLYMSITNSAVLHPITFLIGGALTIAISVSIGFILGVFSIRLLSSRRTKNNVNQSSIVVEFIKAKIKKYCPTITWKNKNS
jgi:hypothetical protein